VKQRKIKRKALEEEDFAEMKGKVSYP